MKRLILYLFVFQFQVLWSQQHPSAPVFPNDWVGIWEGTLHIYRNQSIVQSLPMVIENLPTDTSSVYTWAIIYGQDKVSGRRSYLLRAKDTSAGHYIIDEQNGILLDGFVMGNKYISVFDVMGNTLTSCYTIEGDSMIFEILVNETKPLNTTGNIREQDKDEIPEVKTYRMIGYQKAVLKRVG